MPEVSPIGFNKSGFDGYFPPGFNRFGCQSFGYNRFGFDGYFPDSGPVATEGLIGPDWRMTITSN